MRLLIVVLGVLFSSSVSAEDICRIALESNSVDEYSTELTSKIAFEKKEELCDRDYESTQDFRNSARRNGFSVSYDGLTLGHTGGKASKSGKIHFREEEFCYSGQDKFMEDYALKTYTKLSSIAIAAWRQCVLEAKRNALWLEYNLYPDATGFTGTLYRTLHAGTTELQIESIVVQPNNMGNDVSCTLGGAVFTRDTLAENGPIDVKNTKYIFECTKPAGESLRVALNTTGDSLVWVDMPSFEEKKYTDAEEVELRLTQRIKALEKQNAKLHKKPFAGAPYEILPFEVLEQEGKKELSYVKDLIPSDAGVCFSSGHGGSYSYAHYRVIQHNGYWRVQFEKRNEKGGRRFAYVTCLKFG